MVRLLQSGIIPAENFEYKYLNDLHANEIVLLAYYIAAINIEETYHDINTAHKYAPFDGIVLADTFQIGESKGEFEEKMFPENNKRVKKQLEVPIQVIIGNPPYSAGQDSENEDNKNYKYDALDERIRDTYAALAAPGNKSRLYDSYVRAFRWASDRLSGGGVIGFVTNGSYVDSNSMDGLRKSLVNEFSTLYIFNLRGNARTQGEQRRKEKGNVFGEGSRTPVAISILVKNPERPSNGEIFYHDIGDYLSREEKLKVISEFGSIDGIKWDILKPNDSADWINQRDPSFDKFVPIGDKGSDKPNAIFNIFSGGVKSNRDSWVHNFSQSKLVANIQRMINSYNQELGKVQEFLKTVSKDEVEKLINNDEKDIKWTSDLKGDLFKGIKHSLQKDEIVQVTYRPFTKNWYYFNKHLNWSRYLFPRIFPNKNSSNIVIGITGNGTTKDFSCFIYKTIADYQSLANSQNFPMYIYEEAKEKTKKVDLFSDQNNGELSQDGKIINVSDYALNLFSEKYSKVKSLKITKEDIFYYTYGVLHSNEYRNRFASDLKKMLPRIPFANDFEAFCKAGKALADWHLNYETIEPYNLSQSGELSLNDDNSYLVNRMIFAKVDGKEDKSKIIFNGKITLGDIPMEAYEYQINGKSGIEWVMERYQITSDKDSGISNDPNDWSRENKDPEYILNLLKRVVRVSVESLKIINSLPKLDEMK
jgi:predicted helicase